MPLHLGFAHVAQPAEQLNRLVGNPFRGFHCGVLGEADLGDQVGLARGGAFGDMPGVDPRHVDPARHFRERVLHGLAADQWAAEGFPVAAPLQGQIQATLGVAVGLHREAHPLADERRGDLREPRVLGAHEVRDRHAHIHIRQFGGVGGQPAHLLQLAAHRETGAVLLDQQQRHTGRARTARTHGGHHEVRPHAGGDEGLGSVDHVVVTIAHRAGGEVADIGTATGFGDGQRADLVPGESGLHPGVDQLRVARGRQVRHRDTAGEQGGEQSARTAGVVHLLGHHRGVDPATAGTTDRLRELDAEQAEVAGLPVQFARDLPGALPVVQIGQDLALGETSDSRT